MPKLNYNFKNDYSRLNTVNAFFTVKNTLTDTEGVTGTFNGVEFSADALTGEIGELIFNPNFNETDTIISDSNFFYDFGDGNVGTGLSAKHIYNLPGEYDVTFVVSDSAGNLFRSLDTKKIKVRDLIQDEIILTTGQLSTQPFSNPSVDINISRFNSIESTRYLSTNNFLINLSVSGNRNKFFNEEEYLKDKNFQFNKGSFFIEGIGEKFKVIDKISTTSDQIKVLFNRVGDKMVLTNTNIDTPNTFFIGTSGFASFKYYED